jgi:hypothetical protein
LGLAASHDSENQSTNESQEPNQVFNTFLANEVLLGGGAAVASEGLVVWRPLLERPGTNGDKPSARSQG